LNETHNSYLAPCPGMILKLGPKIFCILELAVWCIFYHRPRLCAYVHHLFICQRRLVR
jgi:hypothetical protein